MAEFQQMSAFDQPIDMVQQDGDNVGKFEMTGIDKKCIYNMVLSMC